LRSHPMAHWTLILSGAVAWWRRSTETSSSVVAESTTDGNQPGPILRQSEHPLAEPGQPIWTPSPRKRDTADPDGAAALPTANAEARISAPIDYPNYPDYQIEPQSPGHSPTSEGETPMTDHSTALKGAMQIDGALGVALVDSTSGMALATAGSPMDIDLDVAAAGNSNVMQAKLRTMADLGLNQAIEDILITLDKQYHIIRPLARQNQFFLYLVLDRARANLAMARFKLAGIEQNLKI
jgi:hypothetical protein